MKRIYKSVTAVAENGAFGVRLDGKPLRTPAKEPLLLPSRALAVAIAAEWDAQGEILQPSSMPLMRLASTAIDLVSKRREAVIDELTEYAGTDLLCYRAEEPPELIAEQQAIWQPLLDWATLRYDAPLTVTSGVMPVGQPAATLRALTTAIREFPPLELTVLHAITTAAGSLIIGLAFMEHRIDAEEAFTAAQIDESFEISRWGEDAEQALRRAGLRDDMEAAAHFLALLREKAIA